MNTDCNIDPNQTPARTSAVLQRTGGCSFSLDSNTANQHVRLSDSEKKATWVKDPQQCPAHDGRFDSVPQVLCTDPLPQRCQVEVEFTDAVIAFAYGSIKRKGRGNDVLFGKNDKSWSLGYDKDSRKYFFSYNNIKEDVPPPPVFTGVSVFLERETNTLHFSTFTCPQSLVPWFKPKVTFTDGQDLYLGFRVPGSGSSATMTYSDCRLSVSPA